MKKLERQINKNSSVIIEELTDEIIEIHMDDGVRNQSILLWTKDFDKFLKAIKEFKIMKVCKTSQSQCEHEFEMTGDNEIYFDEDLKNYVCDMTVKCTKCGLEASEIFECLGVFTFDDDENWIKLNGDVL